MPFYEVTFRTSPIDDTTEDILLNEMDALVATHGTVTLITVATDADCGIDAAWSLARALRSHGVNVHRVEKDLVNASAIASRCGESRAAVTNYIQGSRRTSVAFPEPEVSGSPSLWRWPDVNNWLQQVGKAYDADISYLTRDEESMVDHRLCVARRAATVTFTALITPSMTAASTPADEAVEVGSLKLVS